MGRGEVKIRMVALQRNDAASRNVQIKTREEFAFHTARQGNLAHSWGVGCTYQQCEKGWRCVTHGAKLHINNAANVSH